MSRFLAAFLDFGIFEMIVMILQKSGRNITQWKLFFCQEPVRSAIIDSCIRVTDNGRAIVHRKVRTLNSPNAYAQSMDSFLLNLREVPFWAVMLIMIFTICRPSFSSRFITLPIPMISSRWVAFSDNFYFTVCWYITEIWTFIVGSN